MSYFARDKSAAKLDRAYYICGDSVGRNAAYRNQGRTCVLTRDAVVVVRAVIVRGTGSIDVRWSNRLA